MSWNFIILLHADFCFFNPHLQNIDIEMDFHLAIYFCFINSITSDKIAKTEFKNIYCANCITLHMFSDIFWSLILYFVELREIKDFILYGIVLNFYFILNLHKWMHIST